MTDFGKNLCKLRKARKLTQLQLGELIGVQPRLIGRWEQGQGKPHFDYLVKLADALEVSEDLTSCYAAAMMWPHLFLR